MAKKMIVFLLTTLILFLLFRSSLDCMSLKNSFRLSYEEVGLQLEGDIHNDVGMPILLVRFFHNKPVYISRELVKKALLLGDLRYLINLPFCIAK